MQEQHSLLKITYNYLKLAIPAIISCVFLELTLSINMVFAGSLGSQTKLAGVGLGSIVL